MASIEYDDIFSRFYTKVEAYDLLKLSRTNVSEMLISWLHSATFNPYVRRLFKSASLDDDEEVFTYEMQYSIDEEADNEFVIEVLAYGIVYEWINPRVNSTSNLRQMFGSSDEKWYSQASHLAELRGVRDEANARLRSLIRDRGYTNNTYLDGTSPSSLMRS